MRVHTASGGATPVPGSGKSYALPLKKEDLALGPACNIVMKCKAYFQII